jgi:hypothetical protein
METMLIILFALVVVVAISRIVGKLMNTGKRN